MTLDVTFKTVESNCSYCNEPFDAATGGIGVLRDGDVSVCIHCGGLHLFAGDRGKLRRPTQEELTELLNDPLIRTYQRIVRQLDHRSTK